MFQVGEAETLRPHNFSVPRYQKSQPGNVLPVHLAFDVRFYGTEVIFRGLAESCTNQNEKSGNQPQTEPIH